MKFPGISEFLCIFEPLPGKKTIGWSRTREHERSSALDADASVMMLGVVNDDEDSHRFIMGLCLIMHVNMWIVV